MHPRGRGRRASMPVDFASRLRGSSAVRPCTVDELARILRATLRAFPPPARRDLEGPREEQSAAVPAAEAEAHKPRRPREGGDPAPWPLLCSSLSGPSVKRRRSDGRGRVHRTRCGPGRPAFGDRAGALPPNPGRPQRTGRRPARNRGCISLVTFFVQAKKVTRPPGGRTKPNRDERCVRARRYTKSHWVPAFAGTTN